MTKVAIVSNPAHNVCVKVSADSDDMHKKRCSGHNIFKHLMFLPSMDKQEQNEVPQLSQSSTQLHLALRDLE